MLSKVKNNGNINGKLHSFGRFPIEKKDSDTFKGGSFKAATKSKCPIVPVALIDSFKPFDCNNIKKCTVQIHYLPAIYYDEYKDKLHVHGFPKAFFHWQPQYPRHQGFDNNCAQSVFYAFFLPYTYFPRITAFQINTIFV